jgi:hypothetical protein
VRRACCTQQHTSAIGKFANVFEQQAAQQTNVRSRQRWWWLIATDLACGHDDEQDTISEQNIKMQRDARREQENRKREALAKLKAEEEEKARLEAERKARVQAGLAKLKANINASS